MEGGVAERVAEEAAAEDVAARTLQNLTVLATPGEVSGTMGTPVPTHASMQSNSAW